MPKEIEERVRRAIEEQVFPGCVIGIVRVSGERHIFPFGTRIYESAETVSEDTVYDVASITKSIPVASLALLFIEKGKLSLTDRVQKYLPELKSDYDATIEDLLKYRVHGTQLSRLKDKSPEEFITQVFSQGFNSPPSEPIYTNLPAFLLGLIIERVEEESLDVLGRRHFFEPLGMKNTTFFATKSPYMDFVPTEIDEKGEIIRGIVHDESARVFAKAGRAVGHAGLFSTAPDLLNFLEVLLKEQYPYVVKGAEKGLGWQINDKNLMGKYYGPRTFGKTGFTGTSVICDVERGIAFVILSNRTYPKRPPNNDTIFAFRGDIADIIFKNL